MNSPVVATVVNVVWLAVVVVVFASMGFLDKYMSFGPDPSLKFLNITVDTWEKWSILIVYTLASNVVQIYTSDVIYPWIVTQVQNTKTPLIYSKGRSVAMVLLYNFSVTFGSFIGIYIVFTQADFMLATIIAQLSTNAVTTTLYIRKKDGYLPV